MEGQVTNEGPPKLYSIPEADFVVDGKNVETPTKYSYPNTVTRDNFIYFINSIFARSRGSGSLLWAQCEWLKKNHGFDYGKTFHNFVAAGGSQVLSNAEFDVFKSAFTRIPSHTKLNDDTLRSVLYQNIQRLGNSAYPGADRDLFNNFVIEAEIDACATKEDLFKLIDEHARKNKNQRPII